MNAQLAIPDNADVALMLLTLGLMFLVGLSADLLGRFTFLPRVTLLMLAGIVAGPSVSNIMPRELVTDWFPPLTYIALSMIGFLIGQQITIRSLRVRGLAVLSISIGKVLGAATFVFVALRLLDVDLPVALLLAGIAPATAPAATYDVVKESEVKGEFPETLLSVVALDDAWGLLLFTFLMAVVGTLVSDPAGGAPAVDSVAAAEGGLLAGVSEIGGSILIGLGLGVPMAYITGRIRAGEPTQAEAIGLILLCAGLSTWFGFSPILAAMVLGATVSSLARHHSRPFHAIEGIEWPFMILFFVLAGASLEVETLPTIGWIGAAYIAARTLGIYVGSRVGGRVGAADPVLRRWLGLALLPQAGVALGMALLAAQRFPDVADVVLTVILATTVVFELTAPMITRAVLRKVADA